VRAGLHTVPGAAAATLMVGGSLVLMGWTFDIDPVKHVLPGLPTMKANTAVGFLLMGIALWCSRDPAAPLSRRAMACVSVTASIAAVTSLEHLTGWDAGIDQFLFQETVSEPGSGSPGRMAPLVALAFLITGALLAGPRGLIDGHRRMSAAAVVLVLAVSLSYLVPHAYGAKLGVSGLTITPVAIHAAVGFMVLALGLVVLRLPSGPVRLITGRRMAATLTRRMPLAAFAIPLVLGWLALNGQQAGVFSSQTGESLLVVATMLVMGGAVWPAGNSLDVAERERSRAEAGSRLLATIVENAEDAMISKDLAGRITSWNHGAEQMYGWPAAEAMGRHISLIFPQDLRPQLAQLIERIAGGERIDHLEDRSSPPRRTADRRVASALAHVR